MKSKNAVLFFLGAASQAFMTSFLTAKGVVTLDWRQQFMAGIFFLIVAVVHALIHKYSTHHQ